MPKDFENARLELAMLYLRLKGEPYETEAALLDAFHDTLKALDAAENARNSNPNAKPQQVFY